MRDAVVKVVMEACATAIRNGMRELKTRQNLFAMGVVPGEFEEVITAMADDVARNAAAALVDTCGLCGQPEVGVHGEAIHDARQQLLEIAHKWGNGKVMSKDVLTAARVMAAEEYGFHYGDSLTIGELTDKEPR